MTMTQGVYTSLSTVQTETSQIPKSASCCMCEDFSALFMLLTPTYLVQGNMTKKSLSMFKTDAIKTSCQSPLIGLAVRMTQSSTEQTSSPGLEHEAVAQRRSVQQAGLCTPKGQHSPPAPSSEEANQQGKLRRKFPIVSRGWSLSITPVKQVLPFHLPGI